VAGGQRDGNQAAHEQADHPPPPINRAPQSRSDQQIPRPENRAFADSPRDLIQASPDSLQPTRKAVPERPLTRERVTFNLLIETLSSLSQDGEQVLQTSSACAWAKVIPADDVDCRRRSRFKVGGRI
jgi:hypothetical protein